MKDLERIDGELRELNARERALHAEKPTDTGIVVVDAHQQAVAEVRRRRVELLRERGLAAAAQKRNESLEMRRQADRIRVSAKPHVDALRALGEIPVKYPANEKSAELERRADLLDREARKIGAGQPKSNGNVHADSLRQLIDLVFADQTIIPPPTEEIEQWAVDREVRRFGGLAPHVARAYHLIWEHGEIDREQSSITWKLAAAEVA